MRAREVGFGDRSGEAYRVQAERSRLPASLRIAAILRSRDHQLAAVPTPGAHSSPRFEQSGQVLVGAIGADIKDVALGKLHSSPKRRDLVSGRWPETGIGRHWSHRDPGR